MKIAVRRVSPCDSLISDAPRIVSISVSSQRADVFQHERVRVAHARENANDTAT